MRQVIYEREVQVKLAELKDKLSEMQGAEKALKTLKGILNSLENVAAFSSIGKNIKNTYNVDCPDNWYLLYVSKNYFVFSKTEELITVLKMYDNRQDFICDLFGIEMRSQDSIDYWGE